MNTHIAEWVKEVIENMKPLGRVLEIGSLDVNGEVRSYFDCEKYIGIDIQAGKNVDIVMNAHHMAENFKEGSFDVVVDLDLLEHDDKFWITLENINKVLKKGGFHVLCVPTFNFPIHRYPKDYWRFGEDAVREVVMAGYEIISYKEIFTKEFLGKPINPVICVLGRKL